MVIGIHSNDVHTHTVADAAEFERLRTYDDGYDDRPSARDLAADAESDRLAAKFRKEREDAARARGEYVPDVWDRGVGGMIEFCLIVAGHTVEVLHVREHVMVIQVNPLAGPVTVEDVERACGAVIGTKVEVREHEGRIWLRRTETGLLDDEPPF